MEKQYTIYIKGSVPKGSFFPIVSWLIRLIEWSDISHTFFYFEEDNKIFHAHFNDIKSEDADEYYKNIEERYSFKLRVNEVIYKGILSHLENIKGKKKGYFLQLLGTIPVLFMRRVFNCHIKNPFNWGTSKTCTQVVAETCNLYIDGAQISFNKIGPLEENITTQDIIKYANYISQKD